MKYRYIIANLANASQPINYFNLISAKIMHEFNNTFMAIKVEVPDDLTLTKGSLDNYYTTEDKRSIKDFNPRIVFKNMKTWLENDELTKLFIQGNSLDDCKKAIEMKGYHIIPDQGYASGSTYMRWYKRNWRKIN